MFLTRTGGSPRIPELSALDRFVRLFTFSRRFALARATQFEMIVAFLRRRQSADHELDACDHNPGLGAGDGGFEDLGQRGVAIELGQGPLDHPSSPQNLEAFRGVGPLDYLQGL